MRRSFGALAAVIVLAVASLPVFAASSGQLDATFGRGGRVGLATGRVWRTGLLQGTSGNGLYVVLNPIGASSPVDLVRLASNGERDAAFGGGGSVHLGLGEGHYPVARTLVPDGLGLLVLMATY